MGRFINSRQIPDDVPRMLTQACWGTILSKLTDRGKVHLKTDIMDEDNSCNRAQTVQSTLAELEELGWVEIEDDSDSVIVRLGWKADMFSAPTTPNHLPVAGD